MKALFILLLVLAVPSSAFSHPDPAHSLAELEKHLKDTPGDPILHLRKAELLLRRNHPETARPSVERAFALAPENPEIALLKVRLAYSEKHLPEALAHAKQVTSRFPAYPPGWKWLARLQKESGNPNGAIEAKLHHLSFRNAVDPGDFMTTAAWMKERNDKGDIPQALSTLDEAIAIFGPIVALQQAAIPLDISLSRYEEALARVTALVKKYGPSASSSLLRADVHEAAGRYAEAAAACDSAIALLENMDGGSDGPLAIHREKIIGRKALNLRKAEMKSEATPQ